MNIQTGERQKSVHQGLQILSPGDAKNGGRGPRKTVPSTLLEFGWFR